MKAIVAAIIVLLSAGEARSLPGATITGQLVDARTFQPLRGAVVSAARVRSTSPDDPAIIGFRTDFDGKFVLRDVSPGIVHFFVAKAGYAPGPYASVRPAADGEQIDNVVLAVLPGASVSGRIVDETGQPVSGERITLQSIGTSPGNTRGQPVGGTGITDDDGQYWIGGLSAGEYIVTVDAVDQPVIISFGGELVSFSGVTNRASVAPSAKVTLAAGEERTAADVVIRFGNRFIYGRPIGNGTASIEGRVVDGRDRGIAHAAVLLNRSEKNTATIRTRADADGGFRFQNLPGGSYSLVSPQPGILSALDARQATTLQVAEGSRTENVTLLGSHGGTITGTVTDEFGDPALAVVIAMTSMRLEEFADSRSLILRSEAMRMSGGNASTDARGRYRINDVPPGEYLVHVVIAPVTARTEIHFRDSAGQDRELIPGSLFYPGVLTVSQAAKIKVDDGSESSGIDVTVRPAALANINVTVTSTRPVAEIQLHQILLDDRLPLLENSTKIVGSTVTLDARPGRYRLLASAEVTSNADNVVRLWSVADVETDPLLPATVSMALEPGANLSGRIIFEGREPNRQNAGASLLPILSMPGIRIPTIDGNSTLTVATGEFSIEGVMPGRYVIQAGGTDPRAPWMLKGALVRGRDVLDQPIDLSAGEEIGDVRLTLTDRIGELSGRIADTTDQPGRNDWVVIFSTDSKHWYAGSRRTRIVRPDNKGVYSVRALPAGSYFLALSPNPPSQANDLAATLETLATSAVRVTLAEGDKKVQDLRRR